MRGTLAAAGAASLAALLAGCGGSGGAERQVVRKGCIADPPARIKDGFREPRMIVSEDGVLETTLRASYSPVDIDGTKYKTMNYNSEFPGPTLVICPGD